MKIRSGASTVNRSTRMLSGGGRAIADSSRRRRYDTVPDTERETRDGDNSARHLSSRKALLPCMAMKLSAWMTEMTSHRACGHCFTARLCGRRSAMQPTGDDVTTSMWRQPDLSESRSASQPLACDNESARRRSATLLRRTHHDSRFPIHDSRFLGCTDTCQRPTVSWKSISRNHVRKRKVILEV